jgi:hypothetical protein
MSKATVGGILLAAALVGSSGGAIDLPRTGQVTCWDEAGSVVSCGGTGQDGDLLAGIELPTPRLTDNGDGTVTDELTGLVWLKDVNCADTIGHDPDSTGTGEVSWVNALGFVSGINDGTYSGCQAGQTDWRLPNVVELMSLHDYGELGPALATGHPFGFFSGSAVYWSSTSNSSNGAWTVFFSTGNPEYAAKGFQNHKIWPVRGANVGPLVLPVTGQTECYDEDGAVIACAGTGQDGELQRGRPWPSPRFVQNPNGTITDELTGLVWLADLDCAATAGYDPDGTGDGTTTWQHALDFAAELNQGLHPACGGGQGLWRIPNGVELVSLVSPNQMQPATWLSSVGFTNVPTWYVWSSMTYASPNNAIGSRPADAHAMHPFGVWARVPKTDTLAFFLVQSAPDLSFFIASSGGSPPRRLPRSGGRLGRNASARGGCGTGG